MFGGCQYSLFGGVGGGVVPIKILIFLYIRAVGRDPAYFPDPERFNPQRWLTKEGKIKEELKSFSFGFGRRWEHSYYSFLYCFLAYLLFSLSIPLGYVPDNTWLARES